MKRTLACVGACAVLLALGAPTASAGTGLNLAWSDCTGDGGARDMTFACNSNTQVFTLVGSFFVPDGTVLNMTGIMARVEVSTGTSTVPAWWSLFNLGACRQNALAADAAVPSSAASCVDPWGGAASGGVCTVYSPDGIYADGIAVCLTLPVGGVQPLSPGTEYFAFSLRINSERTVGPGACSGCDLPACIAWQQLAIYQEGPPAPTPPLYLQGGGQYLVTWQSAPLNGGACLAATPAKNRTWGAIKTLYR